LKEYGITAAIAVGLAVWIRGNIIETYRIPSLSMAPTLIPGDTLFVAKWPFHFGNHYTPVRGDIVVFSDPTESGSASLDNIKRNVGLPGDQVSLRNGHVILNGRDLFVNETEKLPGGQNYPVLLRSPTLENFGPERVPVDSVFVIGDFRTKDSKKRKGWGILPQALIKGKALLIWLSVDPSPSAERQWIPRFRSERTFKKLNE
jgi:signal peptidase I